MRAERPGRSRGPLARAWRTAWLAAVWLCGCGVADQVIVLVEPHDPRPTDVLRIRVLSAAREPVPGYEGFEASLAEVGAVATVPIGVQQRGESPQRFELYVEQRRDGQRIASAYASSFVIPGERRYLRMRAHPDCQPSCALGETCVEGSCRSACARATVTAEEEPARVACGEDLLGACGECERARGGRCEVVEDGLACGCAGDACAGGRCVPASTLTRIEPGPRHVCAAQSYECAVGSDDARCVGPCPSRTGCSGYRTERVVCWGTNDAGELGVPGATVEGLAVPDLGSRPDLRLQLTYGLALGSRHSCALSWDAVMRCFGDNGAGQCGVAEATTPGDVNLVRVPPAHGAGVRGWVRGVSGSAHTCGAFVPAIATAPSRADPVELYCWGSDDGEALGDGVGGGSRHTPGPVLWSGTGYDALDLAAYDALTCGVLGGRLWCWGSGRRGVLGESEVRAEPVEIPLDDAALQVGVGSDLVCVRTSSDILCRGVNDGGELGRGSLSEQESSFEPVAVPGPWLELAVGRRHVCAVHEQDGATYCWGQNRLGELGPAAVGTQALAPTLAGVSQRFVELAAGDAYTCGRTALGAVHCWGRQGPATGGEERVAPVQRVCPPPLDGI